MFGDLRGRRVTVMGLGRFGGGVGATRFLSERGARVTVTDLADAENLAESLAGIADLRLERLRLGGHDESDFREAELVVASPAVPIDHPLLLSAEAAGVPITTEVGLFWAHCGGRVIGVTGSVGKSTTAAMIHAVIAASGRTAWLGGNIGGSLLGEVDQIGPADWVVLELSSFQLERLAAQRPRPEVAVVTNFRPNHLDRHGTLEAYRRAKQNLLRWQEPGDIAVLNVDDPDVSSWPTAARRCWFGAKLGRTPDGAVKTAQVCEGHVVISSFSTPERPLLVTPQLMGRHNRLNAAAAAAAGMAVGIEGETIATALGGFAGLPHRLQVIGDYGGRVWVNDSKATTPEAAIVALRSVGRPVRLIAGGADKGIDLTPLIAEISASDVTSHFSGQTARRLAEQLAGLGRATSVHDDFDSAVRAAWRFSQPGDVILLSPGCASWGQFRDYRERGERFMMLAKTLTTAEASESHR